MKCESVLEIFTVNDEKLGEGMRQFRLLSSRGRRMPHDLMCRLSRAVMRLASRRRTDLTREISLPKMVSGIQGPHPSRGGLEDTFVLADAAFKCAVTQRAPLRAI